MNPDRYAGDVTPPPFVSYAQNLEDVVLSRLLTAAPHGRFIDVGAGHPVHGNVMHGLYMHGWRGINVEPMPVEAELLRAMRPHASVRRGRRQPPAAAPRPGTPIRRR